MIRRRALFLFLLFAAAGAQAILPPDASVREPEIRSRRIRNRRQYEQRLKKLQDHAVQQYERTKRSISLAPWERSRILDGESEADQAAAVIAVSVVKEEKKKHFLASIMLLLLIATGVAYVRFMTGNEEK